MNHATLGRHWLKMTGFTQRELMDMTVRIVPDIDKRIERVHNRVPFIKRQINVFQGYLMVAIATDYNYPTASILEIGTAWGFSAACIAEGAPAASIHTINPKEKEFPVAQENLAAYPNVTVTKMTSNALFEWSVHNAPNQTYDFIFVDGDHDNVRDDFKFWHLLRPNGLMLFHDYSSEASPRPCRPVVDALNEWRDNGHRRPFDLEVIDDNGLGMVGWVKNGE